MFMFYNSLFFQDFFSKVEWGLEICWFLKVPTIKFDKIGKKWSCFRLIQSNSQTQSNFDALNWHSQFWVENSDILGETAYKYWFFCMLASSRYDLQSSKMAYSSRSSNFTCCHTSFLHIIKKLPCMSSYELHSNKDLTL